MKNSIFLLLTLCFLCQCSCKKSILANDDDDNPPMTELEKLPPITSEGANTFGCLVNGEAWTPKGYIFPDANFDVYYDEVYFHNLNISTYRQVNDNEPTKQIALGIKFIDNTSVVDTFNFVNMKNFNPCNRYQIFVDKQINIIKLDTINKIVSGTFEFTVTEDEDDNCTDTLHITDGRFDAIYRY